jgi:hypothetical protein
MRPKVEPTLSSRRSNIHDARGLSGPGRKETPTGPDDWRGVIQTSQLVFIIGAGEKAGGGGNSWASKSFVGATLLMPSLREACGELMG